MICDDIGVVPSLTAIRRLFNTSISTFTPKYTWVFAQTMAVMMAPKYQLVLFELGQCFNSSNFCCQSDALILFYFINCNDSIKVFD